MAECARGVYGTNAISGFTARVLGEANAWQPDGRLNLPGQAQRVVGIRPGTYGRQAFAVRQEKLLERTSAVYGASE